MTRPQSESSSRIPSAESNSARAQLEAVQSRLFSLGASANAAGVLDPDRAYRLRKCIKAGAPNKLHSSHLLEVAREESENLAQELITLLAEHGVAGPSQDSDAAKGGVMSSRSTPAVEDQVSENATDNGDGTGEVPTPRSIRMEDANRSEPASRQLAELRQDELEELSRNWRLVEAMEGGLTAAQALTKEGMKVTGASKRWAQRLFRESRKSGRIVDGRRSPSRRQPTVMTSAMQAFAEAVWMSHRGASAEGVLLVIRRHIEGLRARISAGQDVSGQLLGPEVSNGEVILPKVPTLYRFFNSLGADKAKIRELGYEEWVRQNRPITREEEWARRANEEWQIDHTPGDVWVRVLDDTGRWVYTRPFITSIIDAYSRAIMAVVVSARNPDAFTTAHALRMAILPKRISAWTARGLPDRLVLDNGPDFRAHSVAAILGALRIKATFCQPHSPDQKPHIERWFRTLSGTLFPVLPGYVHGKERGDAWTAGRVDRLLTIPELRNEIERWLTEHYHVRLHSETGQAPMRRWEESVPLPTVPAIRNLDVLLLHTAERQISRGVVRFSTAGRRKTLYYTPAMLSHNGTRVRIRYNPDDLASILLYDATTRSFLGEAWDLNDPSSLYTKEDVREAARTERAEMSGYVSGLEERLEVYHSELVKSDRLSKERRDAGWDKARKDAEARVAAAAHEGLATSFDADSDARDAPVASPDEEAIESLKAKMLATSRARRLEASMIESDTESPRRPGAPQGTSVVTKPRLLRPA